MDSLTRAVHKHQLHVEDKVLNLISALAALDIEPVVFQDLVDAGIKAELESLKSEEALIDSDERIKKEDAIIQGHTIKNVASVWVMISTF